MCYAFALQDYGQQTTDNGLLGGSLVVCFVRLRTTDNRQRLGVVAVLTFDFRLLPYEAVP